MLRRAVGQATSTFSGRDALARRRIRAMTDHSVKELAPELAPNGSIQDEIR